MKQVLQELGSGRTILADVPAPAASAGTIAIATRCSLVSAGTERMLVEFGRAGWLDRVRQQPEKVRQVFDKLGTDGLLSTIEAVRSKLEQPLSLGYSNVGVVVSVGSETVGFAIGDRVVSNGPHAEVVAAPRNLCARIPDSVSDEAAAFAVVGAIALQGIRLLAPTLGEAFVVTGLGLIGLITVQLLRASGCRVLGIDPDPAKTELARQFGATTVELARGDDPLLAAEAFSRARGVDGVLITAATKSNEPVTQAARMCRKRGRIVLVGVAGLELDRGDFYRKELSFQVSCSYGPGRYDPVYEDEGVDYPYGLVRWTEQRNFEAVLDMMAMGTIDVTPLITHRFAFHEAPRAYDLLVAGEELCLGVLLTYPRPEAGQVAARTLQLTSRPEATKTAPVIGIVGAGNYAGRVLLPALARADVQLLGLASNGGVSAAHFGRKFGVQEVTTDATALIADPRVNTVVIATRHDTHAQFVKQALATGKHVFVEKPLAITVEELDEIEAVWRSIPPEQRPLVMVGFNRRFAPHIVRMKSLLTGTDSPKTFVVTVNAGAIPLDHWTQDPALGGGRIIGEGCHFIDVMRFLAAAHIERWHVTTASRAGDAGPRDDSASITVTFSDGSMGTLHYLADGHRAFPKERIEVFCAGRVLQLDNFRRLRGYGWQGFDTMKLWRQDKGQQACIGEFVSAVRNGGEAPIPFDELLEVSRVTVALGEAARGR
jgi:predicted dehydrogenase/threonine dehydrogenase-like Zn-dependent dehydrogenase